MNAARFIRWGAPAILALLFAPTLAHADPITATATFIATTFTVSTATATAIATFVVNSTLYTAASLAIPFSRRRLSGKGRGK